MQKLDCVLLVDDDEVTNFLHETLIQDLEAAEQVMAVGNGSDALSLLQEQANAGGNAPNLILLDINMPVMSGFEFLEAFKKLDKNFRQLVMIVILTSSLNPIDIKKVAESDHVEFLNKPLTEDKLEAILEKHF